MKGSNVINGSMITMYWNGLEIAEVNSINIDITINRDDVQYAGDLGMDSKITNITAEGSFSLKKVTSHEVSMLSALRLGRDPLFDLEVTVQDPDAFGEERIYLKDIQLNSFVAFAQTVGEAETEREWGFRMNFKDIDFKEYINEGRVVITTI